MVRLPDHVDLTTAIADVLTGFADKAHAEILTTRERQRRAPLIPEGVMLQARIDAFTELEASLRERAEACKFQVAVVYVPSQPQPQSA